MPYVLRFEDVGRQDVARVGGKNASLGELGRNLAQHGIRTPPGFATTTEAYWAYLDANALRSRIEAALKELAQEKTPLSDVGARIRAAIVRGEWPKDVAEAITHSYADLCSRLRRDDVDVAVRSSATAEDLPTASFAGQLETYLNIRGENLLDACKKCLASLFTDRAISYRVAHGFDHMKVALSVGVQAMVRSDLAGAGVMFSIDTETGFDKVVVIDAAWGLGENVVQGAVDPDSYQVFKPFLSNAALRPIVEKRRGGKEKK